MQKLVLGLSLALALIGTIRLVNPGGDLVKGTADSAKTDLGKVNEAKTDLGKDGGGDAKTDLGSHL